MIATTTEELTLPAFLITVKCFGATRSGHWLISNTPEMKSATWLAWSSFSRRNSFSNFW